MVEYFVLNAFTVHLLPCAYNAGIIMKRKKNNFGDSHHSTAEECLSFL